jgi:hypothetical protein
MTESSGTQVNRLAHRSRLPFHSSTLNVTRRSVRQTTWRMTVERGRSSHTTVSARAQTRSLAAL